MGMLLILELLGCDVFSGSTMSAGTDPVKSLFDSGEKSRGLPIIPDSISALTRSSQRFASARGIGRNFPHLRPKMGELLGLMTG
jgi:hypothetical protein